MKVKVLKEEENKMVLKIYNETFTPLELLKEYLLKNGANYAGYYKEHPESKEIILIFEGENARSILEKAKTQIIEDFKDLKSKISNLKIN